MLQNPTLTKNTYYLQLTKNVMSDTISVIKIYVVIVFRSTVFVRSVDL